MEQIVDTAGTSANESVDFLLDDEGRPVIIFDVDGNATPVRRIPFPGGFPSGMTARHTAIRIDAARDVAFKLVLPKTAYQLLQPALSLARPPLHYDPGRLYKLARRWAEDWRWQTQFSTMRAAEAQGPR